MTRTHFVVHFALVAAIGAAVVVPSSMSAQIIFGGDGGEVSVPIGDIKVGTTSGKKAVKKPGDSTSGPVSPTGITADSFAKAKAFAESKKPIIFLNHEMVTSKELSKVGLDSLLSIELREGESEIKNYGEKAKNGVLVFKTGKAGPGTKKASRSSTLRSVPSVVIESMDGVEIQTK